MDSVDNTSKQDLFELLDKVVGIAWEIIESVPNYEHVCKQIKMQLDNIDRFYISVSYVG